MLPLSRDNLMGVTVVENPTIKEKGGTSESGGSTAPSSGDAATPAQHSKDGVTSTQNPQMSVESVTTTVRSWYERLKKRVNLAQQSVYGYKHVKKEHHQVPPHLLEEGGDGKVEAAHVDRGEENQVEVGWAAQLPLQRPLGEALSRCRRRGCQRQRRHRCPGAAQRAPRARAQRQRRAQAGQRRRSRASTSRGRASPRP